MLAKNQPRAEGYRSAPSQVNTESPELWLRGLMHNNKGIPANANTILNASGRFDKSANIQIKITIKYIIFLLFIIRMSFWEIILFSGNCVLTSENCMDGKFSASSLFQSVVTQ